MRPDQLGDLAVFAAIASERSFTRAARRLGVTQSALSQTMKRVEGQLGFACSPARRAASLRPLPASACSPPSRRHWPGWTTRSRRCPKHAGQHRCIAYGDTHGELSPWSFERDGSAVTVTPGRRPVFNDADLLVATALRVSASSTSSRIWWRRRFLKLDRFGTADVVDPVCHGGTSPKGERIDGIGKHRSRSSVSNGEHVRPNQFSARSLRRRYALSPDQPAAVAGHRRGLLLARAAVL
jgi:hypothetical protein